jgi:hypothetical protein
VGLGDLHDILWHSEKSGDVFRGLFVWFLRRKYMPIVLRKGRMEKKEVYMACKNALLFLATGGSLRNDSA